MLVTYPVAARNENWLHESVIFLISLAHQKLDNGENIVTTQKKQQHWSSLLENQFTDEVRQKLSASNGIRDRLFKYIAYVKKITPAERQVIKNCYENQNQIAGLLSGTPK